MVVMWKEKPIPSSFSRRRALSQPLLFTLRSEARVSSSLRISMFFTPQNRLLGSHAAGAGQGSAHAVLQNVEAAREGIFSNGEGSQHLDDFIVRAAGLDNQTALEGRFGNASGHFSRTDVDAAHHPAAACAQAMGLRHALQPRGKVGTAPLHILPEAVIAPEMA